MAKQLAVATGSITFSLKGEKGDSGNSPKIKTTKQYYAITSNLQQPGSWSETQPNVSTDSNKGKFFWIKTVYTWNDGTTTDSITYTYIGKDGDDGTSIAIKGALAATTNLPTSGAALGDGYIIGYDLWVYTGTTTSDSTHVRGFQNVGQIKGKDGASATQYYIHIAWMKDSNGTGFTTSNPNGAAYDYMGTCVNTTQKPDPTDYKKYSWNYVKGAQGPRGYGVKSTTTTYQIGSSGTTPPTGTWSTSVPNITDANPYLWTRTVITFENGTTNTSYSVATRGTKGALIRQHRGFESGSYKYLSGSGAEEFVDVVYYNEKWYQCKSTYTSSSPSVNDKDGNNNARWEVFLNYKAIATDLLLAKNASIDMVGTQQINLYNSTTGNIYGSYRIAASDNDWSLWLGGKTGSEASFGVTRAGYMKCTSGKIGSFEIRNYTDGTGFTFYNLYASHASTGLLPASDISLDYDGVYVWSGKNTMYDYMKARTGWNGSADGSNHPSWDNGFLFIEGNVSSGANDNVSAINILLTGKSGYRADGIRVNVSGGNTNHAINIQGGDVIGYRPYTQMINASSSFSVSGNPSGTTYICTNSGGITISLPTGSIVPMGTNYRFIRRGGNVAFNTSSAVIRRANSSGTTSSWTSSSAHEWIDFFYDGTYWYAQCSGD